MEALMFLRLKVSLAAVKTAISRAPAARAASNPLRLGTSTGSRAPAGLRSRRRTSSEPAICGTQFGDTNAAGSTTDRPASSRARALPVGGAARLRLLPEAIGAAAPEQVHRVAVAHAVEGLDGVTLPEGERPRAQRLDLQVEGLAAHPHPRPLVAVLNLDLEGLV